jgi:hypothetical protein
MRCAQRRRDAGRYSFEGRLLRSTVRTNGEVVLPTGEAFASPKDAGAFVLSKKSCDGWSFWNLVGTNGRVPLQVVRSQAKEAGPLD